ncbi:hypothetical protein ACH5RR_034670 [Cinchona calisaya]|uniref:Probable purine permease n=1 Tax=Cinchona calisaya TaxID=153742 RepID=A0ABD2YF15_9GENT
MEAQVSNSTRKLLLVLSIILLTIGACGGPMIMRLYFIHGGHREWLTGWLQTAGWPIMLIPLIASYFNRRNTIRRSKTKLVLLELRTFIAAAIIGLLVGLSNHLYSFGIKHLPVSTAALILATQLVFTAFSAFILVRQKFNAYTINAIVLLTVGSVVLAIHAGSEKPKGESNKMYVLGFVLTLSSAALTGVLFPLVELAYLKAKQAITYTLVMEFQLVLGLFATVCSTVGMIVNNDFKAIPGEAREYQLGEAKYYVVLVCSAIVWQCFTVGFTGIIFCASSLLSGIILAVLLPVTEVLAVIFYHEKFQAEKGIALALSLWAFVSHFYGVIKHNNKKHQIPETEMSLNAAP